MVCQPPPGPRLRTKTPGLLSPFDHERPIGSTPLVAKPARSVAFVILLALGACSSAPEGTGATTPSPTATVGSSPTPAVQDIMEIEHFAPLEPGTYSIDPDLDPSTPLQVIYEIGAEGWSMWIGAAKFVGDGHVGVSITTVSNLVSHGCRDHAWADPPVGSSVDDLANALADLAPFRVTLPPEDVSLYGYRGKHLALIVPDLPVSDDGNFIGCEEGKLKSWVAAIDTEPRDAYYGYTGPGYREELWILDVDGTRLLISAERSPGSPAADVAEMRAILDSIRIEV